MATKLAKLLLDKGVKLKDLEAGTGISHSTLSQVKNGIRQPEMATIIKIATFLKVDINDIYEHKLV